MAVRAKLEPQERSLYGLWSGSHQSFCTELSDSPHPSVGFAVRGIDPDGSLTVTGRLDVVSQFAVCCSPAGVT